MFYCNEQLFTTTTTISTTTTTTNDNKNGNYNNNYTNLLVKCMYIYYTYILPHYVTCLCHRPNFFSWSLQMSGLKHGKLYNYRVFAENAAGVSDPSNVLGPILADDPHCMYTNKQKNLYT